MYCSQIHECAGMLYEETWYEPDYEEIEDMDIINEPEIYSQVDIEDEPF